MRANFRFKRAPCIDQPRLTTLLDAHQSELEVHLHMFF